MEEAKVCTKCGEFIPLNQFNRDPRKRDGRRAECKTCQRARIKQWEQHNKSKRYADARARYRELPHIQDQVANRTARWKSQHKDQWRAVKSAQRFRRRSKMSDLLCDLTAQQWEEILIRFKHRCAYCGQPGDLTQDHVIPVSKGGHHTASNIVPACGPCNSSKNASAPPVPVQPLLIA
jgi:5-methylcytosine-specific restriction endonuclease McrA